MNTLPPYRDDLEPQTQVSFMLDNPYPGDSSIDQDLPDRAEAILSLTLEKDMLLVTLGVVIDINNMLSPNPQEVNELLTSMIAGAVSFIHPQLVDNDTDYGLRCEIVIEDSIIVCQKILHDILHARRLIDTGNEYLDSELVSKWINLIRIAKAVEQKDYPTVNEIESIENEPVDVRIIKWLKNKKIQFTSDKLDAREMDIMTSHVQFRTKFMLDKYNNLSAEDKERADSLYEIHTYLVALYNDLNINREYVISENNIRIDEKSGLTHNAVEAMAWPNRINGLIVDIEEVIRKMLMPANYDIESKFSWKEDIT